MRGTRFDLYRNLDGYRQTVELFLSTGTVHEYKRGDFFLREGEKTSLMGYIASGGFRNFRQTSGGIDRVVGYSFEGEFVQMYMGLASDASAVSTQAMRNSTVYMLCKEDVLRTQTWEYRCRIAEIIRDDIFGRLLVMQCGTPEERYLSLLAHRPDILNEVSLKEVASVLRMTPETLSRVRKRLL